MRRALKLLALLTFYYLIFGLIVFAALRLFPFLHDYLPVGGVENLIAEPDAGLLKGVDIRADRVESLNDSLYWLAIAIAGAVLTALPVSWVYMEIRDPEEYDQSLIGTIVMLPIVVTGIVIVVHNSLALAFSLAGIAGAVRFRNSLKSTGDALFILLAVGIGISAGIGAIELAIMMSVAFNYCFLALWLTEYGERKGMKRYMSDVDAPEETESAALSDPPLTTKEKLGKPVGQV